MTATSLYRAWTGLPGDPLREDRARPAARRLAFEGGHLDDIEMAPVGQLPHARILKRAVLAGMDVILAARLDALKLIGEMKSLARLRGVTEEQLEEGVRRVLR